MLHQALCSATGIPHSTQIRTRFVGFALPEKILRRKVMENISRLLG